MQPLTRVILVRHGRSTFNEQGRYQGSSNESVLTEQGRKTSRLVGQYLQRLSADTPVDLIYASPLRRVQETTDEIVKAMALDHRPPMVISNDLKEISLSLWEGLTYQQVKQQFASEYQCWQQHPAQFALPVEAEQPTAVPVAIATKTHFPVQDLYRDARKFWHKILPRHAGNTLLVVSHSGTIHALISTALGLLPASHHSLQQSNCGISELVFSGPPELGQRVQLHQLNQTTALGESLPKLKVNKSGLRLLLLASDGLRIDHWQHLAERLKMLPIDFCLSTDEGQPWIRRLMRNHPRVLCLGAQQSDFLQDWQQHLTCSRWLDESLMTGLAIAPATSIQKLLMQALGIFSDRGDHKVAPSHNYVVLRQGHFSVVHYPNNHRPVVQSINA